jgi:hypothetical protein
MHDLQISRIASYMVVSTNPIHFRINIILKREPSNFLASYCRERERERESFC